MKNEIPLLTLIKFIIVTFGMGLSNQIHNLKQWFWKIFFFSKKKSIYIYLINHSLLYLVTPKIVMIVQVKTKIEKQWWANQERKNHESFELWQITKLKQPPRNGNKQHRMWVWNQQPKVERKWCPKVRKRKTSRKGKELFQLISLAVGKRKKRERKEKKNHNSSSWEVLVLK